MLNDNNKSLKIEISQAVNDWLNYRCGGEIALVTIEFRITPDNCESWELWRYMDAILQYCNESLENSIKVLQFINNDFR